MMSVAALIVYLLIAIFLLCWSWAMVSVYRAHVLIRNSTLPQPSWSDFERGQAPAHPAFRLYRQFKVAILAAMVSLAIGFAIGMWFHILHFPR